MRLLGKALTFDDVLLVPAFSQVLPKDTSLATRLSRNITLNLPINTSFGQTTGAFRDLPNTNDTGGRIIEFVLKFNF